MATRKTTTRKTQKPELFFEEDVIGPDYAKIFDLELSINKSDAYDVEEVSITSEAEQHIIDQFHQQYVAAEGRYAIGKLVNTRIAEMGANTSFAMATLNEKVERIEETVQLNRRGKSLADFDTKLILHTGKLFMQTNSIAARSMHEDMRRDPYKPLPAPPRSRRKGAVTVVKEWLFGEKE